MPRVPRWRKQGPSRDAGLLEPPERPQGSPASSSVWREDPGLLSRPCRKTRPSSRAQTHVHRVSDAIQPSHPLLFLVLSPVIPSPTSPSSPPRHDEDLREPLVRRQGSQVSMRVARGSASWLSSHARVKRSSIPPHKMRPDSPVPTLQGLCDPSHPRGVRPRLEGKPRTPLSSRVATGISWSSLCGLK